MLFARGTGSFAEEADRIGLELWGDWERRGTFGSPTFSPIVDLAIPGTRTVGLPIAREATEAVVRAEPAAAMAKEAFRVAVNRQELAARAFLENQNVVVRRGEQGFEAAQPIPGSRGAANMERERVQTSLADAPVPLVGSSVYRETGSDSAFSLVSRAEEGMRRHAPFFVSDNQDLAQSQGKTGVVIELDATLVNGNLSREKPMEFTATQGFGSEFKVDRTVVGSVKSLTFKDQKTLEKFRKKFANVFDFDNPQQTERGLKVVRKPGAKTTKVAKAGEEPIYEELPTPQPTQAATPEIRDARGRIPEQPKVGAVTSVRSAIKAAAFELSLAGVKLDANVFGSIARALVKAEATKTTAGAFNKVFWDEVLAEMPTGTTLRAINERTFVGGIDSTVRDLANREEMVTSVYDYFRRGAHLDPQAPRSLIFQVLQEIKDRGGRVNRQVVAEVVDELRAVSQNPPRKTNARGAQRIDANARRAAVAQIINKRSKSDKEIFLPPSLLRNMTPQAGGQAVSIGGRMAGREPTAGTDREFRDVPKITEWFEGKIPVLKNVFNRSRRLHMSDNGAVRLAAHMIKFASAAFDTAQPQTFIESGMQLLHRLEFSMMKVTRNGYVRFALGGGTENVHRSINPIDNFKTHFGAKGREMRRQFYTRVMAQLESGRYDDGVDAVNTTARELRKLLNETHDLAFKSGLKGFQTSATANYFPWLWRFDRIRRLASTEAGKQDLVKLIRQSWGDQRTVVIDGVEQAFTGDLDEAAKALAERLIRIANRSDNAPLIDQDQELADALAELEGPLKAQQGSRTPFGRSRIQLNRQAGITATADHLGTGRMNLTLQDLRNDDINFVMKKYLTSVVGAVTEKRFFDAFNTQLRARGIRGPRVRNAAGEMVESEVTVENGSQLVGLLNRIGTPMAADEAEALQTLLGALRFAPISDAVTIGDRVAGLVGAYMYLLRGGQFGLAAMTETGRLVGTVGMRTMFTQIPILNQMVSNWKNLDEGAQNFSAMLDTLFAPSTDRMRRVFRDQLVQTDQFASRPQRVLDSLSNWYSDVSGLAPITSFTQQLAAAGAVQHLYDVAKGAAKRLDNATIRALGLEPAQYDQIIQYIGTNGVTRRNFLGLDQVTDIRNIDALEMDQVKAFVQRLVETRIQSVPTRGDFHDKVFSFWGRLLLQFKMFNLKGVDNFLFQNSSRVARGGGIQVSKEIAATGLIAGLMNYARSYVDWKSYVAAGDKERAKQTEEQLTLEGIARGALMGPSEFWAITTAGDMVWTNTIDPDPLFSPFKYSGMKAYEFPGQAAGVQALSLFRDVFGATAGASLGLPSERRITQGTVHRGRLLLPFQNYPGFKQLLNFAEQEVVDTYNLPKTQARDRD
jgi:hypothetical protein